jgi:hypothetical protein
MNEVLTTKARIKKLEMQMAVLQAAVESLQRAAPLVPSDPPRPPLNYQDK